MNTLIDGRWLPDEGQTRNDHVSSQQVADAQSALIGAESCVIGVGTMFEYTIVSNNEITISDGQGYHQGRRFGIDANQSISMAFDNGSAGATRSDLIVHRYTVDNNGYETGGFYVVKGADNAGDPEITTGNIRDGASVDEYPFYRVNLEGINIVSVDTLWQREEIGAIDSTVKAKWETILPSGVMNLLSRILDILSIRVAIDSSEKSGQDNGWDWVKYSDGTYEAWWTERTAVKNGTSSTYVDKAGYQWTITMPDNPSFSTTITSMIRDWYLLGMYSYMLNSTHLIMACWRGAQSSAQMEANVAIKGTWK